MAKYTGHEVRTVKPQLNIPQDGPEITEDQVASWWATFSTSVPADEVLGVSFEEGKNLYYFSDTGDFVRAVNEGEDINSLEVQKRLLENSLNGRLFTRANEDTTPRQVVTYLEEGDEPEVGVSESNDFGAFTWTPLYDTKKPEPLPFWKYLLWPFSSAVREEIKTHRQQTAEFDANYKEALWIEKTRYNDSPCIQEDRHESYAKERAIEEQEYELRQKERAIEEEKERIRAEKEAAIKEEADKKAYREEHEQKKQGWAKNLHDMTMDEYKEYRKPFKKEFSSGSPIRDIIENKHATYEDVLDGVERMLEAGLMEAVSYIYKRSEEFEWPERVMVQKTAYQRAKEGLRDYVRQNVDQNLIKAAFESHRGYSLATDELIDELKKFSYDYDYFNKHGVLTDDEGPAFYALRTKADLLRYQRQSRGEDLQHLDESAEGFRNDMKKIKETWDPDLSQMSPEEFEKYRQSLYYKRNEKAYTYIIENPNSTPEDIYDLVTKEMELLMHRDQIRKPGYGFEYTDLMDSLLRVKVGDQTVRLETDFYTVQKEPWQKAKAVMNQLAHKYVKPETVKKLLESRHHSGEERDALDEEIRSAYKSAKKELNQLGVLFDKKELTPDVMRNILLANAQRTGRKEFENLRDTLTQNGTKPQQKQVQQPTVQQPQVTQSKPKQEKGREV